MSIKVIVKNVNAEVEIDGGQTLSQIASSLQSKLNFAPICAIVNNKTEWLGYEVYSPKTIEFLPITSASGERCYIRSLCMVMYAALRTLWPGVRVSMEHSISAGYYCLLSGHEVTEAAIAELKARMQLIIDGNLPFERIEAPAVEVEQMFASQGLDDKVALLRTLHEPYWTYYKLSGVADSYYGALAPSTGLLKVFDLIPYKEGMLLMGFDHSNPAIPPQPVTQEKMYSAFTDYLAFNRIVGVRNVAELNRAVNSGNSPMLINVSEALHDKRIGTIADRITERFNQGGARVVLIAGPSSSGKTTFTKRLAIHLITNLLEPQMVSLDNYFVDRAHTPRDIDGDYDYESLYALDLDRFNSDLNRLLAGERVELPTYNFASGQREHRGDSIKLSPRSILLIEGIHGLNPELTASVSDVMKYRVYVSALTTISLDDHNWVPTTDNRLLRRIVRDAKYRGTDAASTIRRWPSVRRGEEKWIFPYQENADSTFNSSLLYEPGVLKNRGEEILRRVHHDVPEYAEAVRLRTFLSYFEPIGEQYLPSTSILREFLGGSSFKY